VPTEEKVFKEDLAVKTTEQNLKKEELELISVCILEQIEATNHIPTFSDSKLFEAKTDLRNRLVNLNIKICDMIHED